VLGYNRAMPKARVYITLKPTLLDAQGRTLQNALHQLGFETVQQVRVGKYLEIELAADGDPHAQIEAMCQQLLANPVIEQYRYEVVEE
jgi:phosphoribosylformylglycinamidine synthase PurS subunit